MGNLPQRPLSYVAHPMTRRSKLPLRITLLLGLVLIITAINLVRLLTAIVWSSTLEMYLSRAEVLYIGATGAIWSLVGILVLWSFRRGGRTTRPIFLTAAGLYTAWSWADRLIVQTGPRANWLFSLVVTLILLGYTATVVVDPRNRIHFGKETYERKPESKPSA